MRICFFIFYLSCISLVNAQDIPLLTSQYNAQETILSSAAVLLKQATAIRDTAPKESLDLATKALQISKINKDDFTGAQASILLAELARDEKRIDLSTEYFLVASMIYKQLNEPQTLASPSVESIPLLFKQNKMDQINTLISESHLVAQQYGFSESFAKTLIDKGALYYKKKRYQDAIQQYIYASHFLSGLSPSVQKNLAITYKKMAESYKRIKDREKTAYYYKKTLDIFTKLDDKNNMARTLNTLAEAERYLENYFVALDYSIQGLEIHRQIEDPEGYAKALTGAGVIYRHIGRYEKSLEHIYQAHLYYKKINDMNGIANTSNQMGLLYTRLKQFDLAKSFYQLTIDLPKEKIAPKTLASATREMAVILLQDGDYEPAKVMINKAHKIYQDEKNATNQSLTRRILANIYRAQGNKEKAISYYRQSLAIAKQVKSLTYQIKALLPLGAILIDKNIEEAINLLQESLKLSLETDNKSYQLYSYRELRIANKKKGDLFASISFAEKEIEMMNLLQREREDNKLVLAKATLYSHTKEMELASLKEKAELDRLELSYKNTEIALANQASIISDLELTKNRYANFTLVSLLVICLIAVLFIYRGFINSRKRNQELKYLATRDSLTNCYNRRALFDLMEKDFLNLASINEYCIIMLDIDYFKQVNDNYGHIAGDMVLSGVADILLSCVRKNDTVSRFGGEEFCIVLPDVSKEQCLQIAEEIREQIDQASFEEIKVTCSLGVTSIKFNAQSPTELIQQADLALYQAKSQGRNKVMIWEKV